MSETRHFVSPFPASLLELQSALPNHVLEDEAGPYPTSCAPSCAVWALLCCDFAVRLKANGCSCVRSPPDYRLGGGALTHVDSQGQFLLHDI